MLALFPDEKCRIRQTLQGSNYPRSMTRGGVLIVVRIGGSVGEY